MIINKLEVLRLCKFLISFYMNYQMLIKIENTKNNLLIYILGFLNKKAILF
jgi:hypothetical protein